MARRTTPSCEATLLHGELTHVHGRGQTVLGTSTAGGELYGAAQGLREAVVTGRRRLEVGSTVHIRACKGSDARRAIRPRQRSGGPNHVDIRIVRAQDALAQNTYSLSELTPWRSVPT